MIKKKWSCGYRSMKSCLWFNRCSKKGLSDIKYDKGISMGDMYRYLESKVKVSTYKLEGIEYVSSNMLVHTYYKNKGHYLYLPYVGKKYSFIYDPKCIVPYKLIRNKKLSKFIDFKNDVIVLKIDEEINYTMLKLPFMIDTVIIMLMFRIGMLNTTLITLLFMMSIITVKNSEN